MLASTQDWTALGPPRRLALIALLTVVALTISGSGPVAHSDQPRPANPVARSNSVIDWNANAGDALIAACALGAYAAQEARMFAMMHVAIHDALGAINRSSRPYAATLHAAPGVSANAAVAAASRDVLVPVIRSFSYYLAEDCVRAGTNRVEKHYADALAKLPDNPARARGIALGQTAAAAVLALRAKDGFNSPIVDTAFEQGTEPGEYRFAPGTPYVLAPGLGEDLAPFVLADRAQFRPEPPYPVDHVRYAFDLNEVKVLGGDGVVTPTNRTDEQTQIALFWFENAPQLWNRVARAAATARGLDLWQSARLFGLLDLALADGYLSAFGTMYRYRFWRPVTAVQFAEEDGNPATLGDPTWTPLKPTPATPAYDSEHAVAAGAASRVLTRFFGTDRIGFSICSFTLPQAQICDAPAQTRRRFEGFSDAVKESAEAGIYVGFEFRAATVAGTRHGQQVGDWTMDHALKPLAD